MEIIKAPIYVKLTEKERKTLRDAYDILNELYDVIADNDCEYVSDTCGNGYDRVDVALADNAGSIQKDLLLTPHGLKQRKKKTN